MSTAAISASASDWKVAHDNSRAVSFSVHLHRQSLVLPWHTFLFAEGTDSAVRAVFHSHTVLIEGSALSALLTDLAEQRVTSVSQPSRTAKFQQSTGPLITAISITEAE